MALPCLPPLHYFFRKDQGYTLPQVWKWLLLVTLCACLLGSHDLRCPRGQVSLLIFCLDDLALAVGGTEIAYYYWQQFPRAVWQRGHLPS